MRVIWVTAVRPAWHAWERSERRRRDLRGLGGSERLADGGAASTARATAASPIETTRFLPTG